MEGWSQQIDGKLEIPDYITLIHPAVQLKLCPLFTDTYGTEELLVSLDQLDTNVNWIPT